MKGFSQLKHDDVDDVDGAHRFFAFAAFLIGALTVEWNRSDARPDPGELAADLISDGWVRDVAETVFADGMHDEPERPVT